METNEKYGFPSNKPRELCRVVCFDVDGTLITIFDSSPRYQVIQALLWFKTLPGIKVYVWSGGGIDYAEHWVEKLGLDVEVIEKGSIVPDIAFDDQDSARLGLVTVPV